LHHIKSLPDDQHQLDSGTYGLQYKTSLNHQHPLEPLLGIPYINQTENLDAIPEDTCLQAADLYA
jgi:hypothetical protein